MSPSLATFLFETANVLLLAAALAWLFFKPVRAAIDAERDRQATATRELGVRQAEAEAAATAARAARARVEQEMERHRASLLAAAQQEARAIREDARHAQAEERRALQQDLDGTRQTEAAALTEELGRIAAASVRGLLEALGGPSLDLALVRGACQELPALPAPARAAALVEAARPLGAEARQLLAASLGTGFQERTVPELGAGVRVTTPAGQVDATALALARRAAERLTAADRSGGAAGDPPGG